MENDNSKHILPVLPLKDVVIFPRTVTPLMVGRAASIAAVDAALESGRPIFLCMQSQPDIENPDIEELHPLGVAANILQTLRMPDGVLKIVVDALGRGRILSGKRNADYIEAEVLPLEPVPMEGEEKDALVRTVLSLFEEYATLGQRISSEIVQSIKNNTEEPSDMADLIAAYLPSSPAIRQELLAECDTAKRLEQLVALLMRENEMLGLERRVRDRVREQMERGQREHFLHEQMRAIQEELEGRQDGGDDFTELRDQIEKARMPKEAREKADKELARYMRTPPMSPEGAVVRNYLEWLVEIPWSKRTRDTLDLPKARAILDEDHYGLKKVKERILEFLAVRRLNSKTKGPVLCLVGAPGVGKTSLGRSVARAMGREFTRVSLGGVRDEAEIRGHRRTYIGSLPGRIVQNLRKVGVKNPVFMLDEIDKMTMDYRGDPSSALLEVLDPEQNCAFSDHYLEVDLDLGEVFFITTANSEYDIPPPLLDRMEVVRISGYTAYEKEQLARQFLIPKKLTDSGLEPAHVAFAPDGLQCIIERYTREAGVRELERQIASVCRKVARRLVEGEWNPGFVVDANAVHDLLGPPEYVGLEADREAQIGVAVGLAWTWSGGDILNIETATLKGKGEVQLTGQLGEVMRESAQAAYTYLRAHSVELGIPARFHQTTDLHVHIPEGATPKDGPSAGTSLAVSMLSALLKRPPRAGLAMTGEITLRGRILQVGAVREKSLAAHRAGIKTVILPKDNEKDLGELPTEVRNALEFIPVEDISQVFASAFPGGFRKNPAKAKPMRRRAKAGS